MFNRLRCLFFNGQKKDNSTLEIKIMFYPGWTFSSNEIEKKINKSYEKILDKEYKIDVKTTHMVDVKKLDVKSFDINLVFIDNKGDMRFISEEDIKNKFFVVKNSDENIIKDIKEIGGTVIKYDDLEKPETLEMLIGQTNKFKEYKQKRDMEIDKNLQNLPKELANLISGYDDNQRFRK